MYHKLQPHEIPEETAQVAQAAFPKGNVYMRIRDKLPQLFDDAELTHLFRHQGRRAEAPGTLLLVMVMQYMEGLTDRQAAQAVRARIDWKYALGLKLTDPGFDMSVLSRFRDRLVRQEETDQLLQRFLSRLEAQGFLKGQADMRSDATHVLGAVRELNRLELVGETMRQALNALARSAPQWIQAQVTADWYDLYGARVEEYRLPQDESERRVWAERVGRDGFYLLRCLAQTSAPPRVRELPEVVTLEAVWAQQYVETEGTIRWREKGDLPPDEHLIQSPYDVEVGYGRKRQLRWSGYKVHLTETCHPDHPRLVTGVTTTTAAAADVHAVADIQDRLAEQDCLPTRQRVDGGYMSLANVRQSRARGVDLLGPIPADTSWQGRDPDAYDLSHFSINWEKQEVACPEEKISQQWSASQDRNGQPLIHVRFRRADCQVCSARTRCTRAQKNGRTLRLHPRPDQELLLELRQRQKTDVFKEQYQRRSGIEGTISQGTRSFTLRRTRFRGLAKTHLHHVLVALALNLSRVANWLEKRPIGQTRCSPFRALAPET